MLKIIVIYIILFIVMIFLSTLNYKFITFKRKNNSMLSLKLNENIGISNVRTHVRK